VRGKAGGLLDVIPLIAEVFGFDFVDVDRFLVDAPLRQLGFARQTRGQI
jgi:hypothetical protein